MSNRPDSEAKISNLQLILYLLKWFFGFWLFVFFSAGVGMGEAGMYLFMEFMVSIVFGAMILMTLAVTCGLALAGAVLVGSLPVCLFKLVFCTRYSLRQMLGTILYFGFCVALMVRFDGAAEKLGFLFLFMGVYGLTLHYMAQLPKKPSRSGRAELSGVEPLKS